MYCPSCGSQNQVEVKFCTSCGLNLAVVSEALSGKVVNQAQPDERMVKLLKDYYNGRRASALGGASLGIGFLIMFLLMAAGMPERWTIFGLLGLGCVIYGAIAAIAGVAEWMKSSSELKALSIVASQLALPRAAQPVATPGESDQRHLPRGRSMTESIVPASITEHTTRQLEEQVHSPVGEPIESSE